MFEYNSFFGEFGLLIAALASVRDGANEMVRAMATLWWGLCCCARWRAMVCRKPC